MIPDIFSSFDPSIFKSFIPTTIALLLLNPIIILIITHHIWPTSLRLFAPLLSLKEIILTQLLRTQSKSLKGISTIITTLFLLIVLINLLGILPYFFGLSSHLIITLILGLPLWLGLIISRTSFNPKATMAHFLPDGAPTWLNPFLVLIETISTLVRPITLSFRLAANITAGHVVLALISSYCVTSIYFSLKTSSILILLSARYILFELAICLIQAYIFCLLISLYADEHA